MLAAVVVHDGSQLVVTQITAAATGRLATSESAKAATASVRRESTTKNLDIPDLLS
jgi:hypothetical protein